MALIICDSNRFPLTWLVYGEDLGIVTIFLFHCCVFSYKALNVPKGDQPQHSRAHQYAWHAFLIITISRVSLCLFSLSKSLERGEAGRELNVSLQRCIVKC